MEQEEVICRHIEVVNSATHISLCKRCGQQLQYDNYEREITQVIRRGELRGKQTMIRPPALPREEKKGKEKAQVAAPSSLPETAPVPEPAPASSTPAPKPSKKWKNRVKALEKNKEAVIRDYYALTSVKFFRKWHIGSSSWPKLMLLWNVKPKGKRNRFTGPAAPKTEPQVDETPGEPFQSKPLNTRTGVRAIRNF